VARRAQVAPLGAGQPDDADDADHGHSAAVRWTVQPVQPRQQERAVAGSTFIHAVNSIDTGVSVLLVWMH
jgi:hypothetical protein